MKKNLTLKIVTPDTTAAEYTCTSLSIPVRDDKNGHGGGFYGIHPGHLSTLFALSEDRITAYAADERVFSAKIRGGIAIVGDGTVTVLTDAYSVDN